MRKVLTAKGLAIGAVLLIGLSGSVFAQFEATAPAALEGQVTSAAQPLGSTLVYAYQLRDLSLRRAVTDELGRFHFQDLPAGLYRIIALKAGFAPTITALARTSSEIKQFLEMELRRQSTETDERDFWSLRQALPGDVLRDLQRPESRRVWAAESTDAQQGQFGARMQAMTGLDERIGLGAATEISGGQFGFTSKVKTMKLDLEADFWRLGHDGLNTTAHSPSGVTRSLAFEMRNGVPGHQGRLNVSSNNHRLVTQASGTPEEVDFENYRVSWSQEFGNHGRTDLAAQYTEESNFYQRGAFGLASVPEASRTFRVQGSYSTALAGRNQIEAGFRYRQRQDDHLAHSQRFPDAPREKVELFGRAGYQLQPSALLQYGLYSALSDGQLSVSPHGGVVLQLGRHWQASTAASRNLELGDAGFLHDFAQAYVYDLVSCRSSQEYCYEFQLSRSWGDDEELSISTVHRKFGEALRLYFDEDFFNHLESLYLVDGDRLPQVQVSTTKRLAPNILARIETKVANGGGGILISPSGRYENEVGYLITSMDTNFERTATAVFVAYQRLEQQLNPLRDAGPAEAQVELDRLQLMLTQDLNLLFDSASHWALRLNMELSRGAAVATETVSANEVRKRFMGGLAVTF